MQATITFETGEEFTLEKDGDTYISQTPLVVPDHYCVATITAENFEETFNGLFVEEDVDHSNGYRYTFSDMPKESFDIARLKKENGILSNAIAELAEIIGGGE